MPNTNLLQAAPEKKSSGIIGSGNKSIGISLALLVVVLEVFGGYKYYNNNLNEKIIGLDAQIKSESANLAGKDVASPNASHTVCWQLVCGGNRQALENNHCEP
jgi:hypothetical protein